jgi:alkylation response protein AidB-like acyl-CoA dehydrogenase
MPERGDTEFVDAAEFRRRCDDFLGTYDWAEIPSVAQDPRREQALIEAQRFQRAQYDAGLAGPAFPKCYGGQGLTEEHARIFREAAAHYPTITEPIRVSLGNCAPVIRDFGTEEHKRRWLPALLAGKALACQMFSEPEAGSDVASVRTRAVPDGDEWVLSGQKVWTTNAHLGNIGILLARSDPSVPKHRGLSMFLIELDSPGVEIRPIHQIDGGMEFDEVFLDGLRLPSKALLGSAGEGWQVASAMMLFQRIARGTGNIGGVAHEFYDRLIALKSPALDEPVNRDMMAQLYIAEVTQSLLALRTRAAMDATGAPGPGGSLTKLICAQVESQFAHLAYQLSGARAQAWSRDAAEGGALTQAAIYTLSRSIAGGTSEIQRNIIGDRVLGLPREPDIGKGVPFDCL